MPLAQEASLHRRAAEQLVIDVDPALDPESFAVKPDAIPWTTDDGDTHAICEMDNGFPRVLLPRVGIIRVVDEAGHVRGTVSSAAKIPLMEEVYHRFALPMILQAAGAEMLHASGVLGAVGVVAFCGTSGTGKSTLAYALSRRQHEHWADDSLVFLPHQNAFEALRLPFRPRVEIASSEKLEFISAAASAPLSAIAVLERHTGGNVEPGEFHVEVKRLSPSDAFRAVLPHIYSFILSDPKRNALMMSRYFDIASRLAVFDVRFTPCLDALPKLCEVVERNCLSIG
ncbi:MAG: hypothetical protein IPM54_23755 [Polyangiaceae bacterium]|nr:hypothetical protein [Polyangiaceae bacterium]